MEVVGEERQRLFKYTSLSRGSIPRSVGTTPAGTRDPWDSAQLADERNQKGEGNRPVAGIAAHERDAISDEIGIGVSVLRAASFSRVRPIQ